MAGERRESRGYSSLNVYAVLEREDALIIDGRRVHLVDAVTPQPAPDARCPAEALAARQVRPVRGGG